MPYINRCIRKSGTNMREAQPPARASLTCSEQTDGEGTRRGGDAEPIADCTGKAATDADKRRRCASVRNVESMEL